MVAPRQPPGFVPSGAVALPDCALNRPGPPGPNFVISRHDNGGVLSLYKHLQWNLTPYDPKGRFFEIDFCFWRPSVPTRLQSQLINECKYLLYLLLWRSNGARMALGTIEKYVELLRALAKFTAKNQITIYAVLLNHRLLREYFEATNHAKMKKFMALINFVRNLGFRQTGLKVITEAEQQPFIILSRLIEARRKQTAPIPTRIYTNIISHILAELESYKAIEEEFLNLLHLLYKNPCLGRSILHQRKIAKTNGVSIEQHEPTFDEIISADLRDYLERRGHCMDVRSLSSHAALMQLICKLTLHIFSGARDDEVAELPYDCWSCTIVDGAQYFLLHGSTSKNNKGIPKSVFWTICSEAIPAIQIAQRICRVIVQALDKYPSRPRTIEQMNTVPLFLSTGYLHASTKTSVPTEPNRPALLNIYVYISKLAKILDITITDSDILELEEIEHQRSWREEEIYAIGKDWPIRTNQFRRSLVLYANRSGLVTFPTLKRQLQHITDAMSEYYCNGSSYAADLLALDPDHICGDYQKSMWEAEAHSYIRNVFQSTEELKGAHGIWVEKNILAPSGRTISISRREDVLAKFERGEMAYRETYLGGCSEIGPCQRRAMRSIICCVECKSATILPSRVQRTIKIMNIALIRLRPDSIEYKAKKETLDYLVDTMKRWSA